MKDRFAKGLDRVDRVGGKVVARFWGIAIGVGGVAVLGSMFIWAVATGAWAAAAAAIGVGAGLAVLVRFLFSGNRRLSDFE